MRRIEIGSKVKFLNDIGGGIVKAFKDNKFAIVENDEGFEIPVPVNELIPDEGKSYGMDGMESAGNMTGESVQTVKVHEPSVSIEEKKYLAFKGEVLLAIVPQNDQLLHVSNFRLYLINDSNYSFNYTICFKDAGVSTFVKKDTIEADTKLEIRSFSQTEIGKVKAFSLQGVFFKHGLTDVLKPVDLEFNIEAVSFYKSQFFSENDFFHSQALILKKEEEVDLQEVFARLETSELAKVAEIKEKKEKKPESKSPKKPDSLEEVDLHIEQLIENSGGMSNGEILNIQLARFETALETARRSDTGKVVFIHGVGNGKLKHELRKKLDRAYPNLKYQDASFKEYGYGATMVILK